MRDIPTKRQRRAATMLAAMQLFEHTAMAAPGGRDLLSGNGPQPAMPPGHVSSE
jgi:hypothetical protein